MFACVSQEVLGCSPRDARHPPTRRRIELNQRVLKRLVALHYSGLVAAAVAVVRRREHRDDVLLVVPQISVHHQLVRACDELQAVVTVEPLRNVLPKNVAERRMGVGDKEGVEGQTTSSSGVRGEEGTQQGFSREEKREEDGTECSRTNDRTNNRNAPSAAR